ncbi:Cupin-like domain containing protein [Gracilaria domingensis]|nr:Cupin-like domain containing protein [Gracilaria domingensis]
MSCMLSMKQALDSLYQESRSLWVPYAVAEYNTEPTALPFLRDHVSQSLPCVWRSAAASWQAISLWDDDGFAYVREKVGQKRIEITHTPNGRADAVVQICRSKEEDRHAVFAMPEQRTYRFSKLLDDLLRHDSHKHHSSCDCSHVPYYSAQNSSLVTDMPELVQDIDESLFEFATDAFDAQPSVQNIWIGDGRSVSTTHADPYENLYTVVSGTKIFQLRPPCDAAFLSKPALQNARWKAIDTSNNIYGSNESTQVSESEHEFQPVTQFDGWKLVKEEGETAWIDEGTIDEKHASCLEIRLHAGDILYIPALWCTFSAIA